MLKTYMGVEVLIPPPWIPYLHNVPLFRVAWYFTVASDFSAAVSGWNFFLYCPIFEENPKQLVGLQKCFAIGESSFYHFIGGPLKTEARPCHHTVYPLASTVINSVNTLSVHHPV